MVTSFAVKIFKLLMVIVNLCYFLGLIWLQVCYITRKYLISENADNQETFLDYYELDNHSDYELAVLGTYYALTSLSTVGFGDFAPRSNIERIYITFVLLFCGPIFSYFLGTFMEIIEQYQAFKKDLDDRDQLERFIKTIFHFNEEIPLN